jgi:hypothetical protein
VLLKASMPAAVKAFKSSRLRLVAVLILTGYPVRRDRETRP